MTKGAMRLAIHLSWLAAVLPAAAVAQAADTIAGGSLSGTVYDSVAGRPLAGAEVNVVSAAQITSRVITAITDADGRYLFPPLLPGRYLVSFLHAALDSLALSAPELLVTVTSGQRTTVPLALPSAATIRGQLCGALPAEDSTGVLFGHVRSARTGQAVPNGKLQTYWQQLLLGRGSLALHPRTHNTTIGENGWFVTCGVPAGIEIGAVAISGADSSGFIGVVVPPVGIRRQDFLIGGTGTVRGTLISETDRPVTNARVTIIGRQSLVVSDSIGAFVLAGIPAGTQTLEVRALGHVPERRRLVLAHDGDTTLALRMTTLKTVLDTITVVGQRIYDRDRTGFLRRARSAMGFSMNEAAIARANAIDTYQLLRRAPGVYIDTRALSRSLLLSNRGGGYCVPAIYVDGMRIPGPAFQELDVIVQPHELAGMELYRDPQIPPEYDNLNGCGVLLLWTRARIGSPR